METPTQFSYETFTDKNATYGFLSSDFIFEINELNNNRKRKIENIFDEVNEIKKKKIEKTIDYVDALTIPESEFERSFQDMTKISEMLNEEHIVELISTRKLFFVYKHILEIFAILLGEGYFEWSHFRTKLNIFEIKYRMINCNLANFSKNKINEYLNKIYKNKKLTDEYLKNDNSGIGIIFKWIKAALKVCLYKLQSKRNIPTVINIKEETASDNNNNNNNAINNLSTSNYLTKDKITKFTKIGSTNNRFLGSTSATLLYGSNINNNFNVGGGTEFLITNYKESQSHETEDKNPKVIKSNDIGGNQQGGGFYLTSLNNNDNNLNKNQNNKNILPHIENTNYRIYNGSDSVIKEEDNENTPNKIKKNIPIIKRVCHKKDVSEEFFNNLDNNNTFFNKNRVIEKYNISSLPLLKFKTYHQFL